MKTRIISGLIGFSILLLIVILGGNILNVAILTISLIAVHEFHKAIRNIENINPVRSLNYLFTVGLFLTNYSSRISVDFIIFLYVIAMLVSSVLSKKHTVKDAAVTLLGGLYIPFFFYHMYLLNGSIYIWIVFLSAFATDTFAYFSGVFFGKRKLCPNISPKKTIEGSIGGIIGCLITVTLFSLYFKLDNILGLAILSIVLSIMSQMGDLTASNIKRTAEIKDYGDLMPGHGGILDRFDSILFTTPIVYYFITYII